MREKIIILQLLIKKGTYALSFITPAIIWNADALYLTEIIRCFKWFTIFVPEASQIKLFSSDLVLPCTISFLLPPPDSNRVLWPVPFFEGLGFMDHCTSSILRATVFYEKGVILRSKYDPLTQWVLSFLAPLKCPHPILQ